MPPVSPRMRAAFSGFLPAWPPRAFLSSPFAAGTALAAFGVCAYSTDTVSTTGPPTLSAIYTLPATKETSAVRPS